MKIEIELEEVEALRATIKRREEKIKELEEKLEALDVKELRRKALYLADYVFKGYFTKMCNDLGFEASHPCWSFNDFDRYLERPWESEALKFEVSLDLKKEAKRVYLNLMRMPEVPIRKQETLEV